MSDALILLGAMMITAVTVLVSVALGGYLVYRTKREAHEPFVMGKAPAGEVHSVDPFADSPQEPLDPAGEIVREQNSRFLRQMMADRAAERNA